MIQRDIYSNLVKWKTSEKRKPLILKGARQVGKTHILKHFGAEEYQNSVYFNFERDPALSDFFRSRVEPTKVNFLNLYPLTFLEFLEGIGSKALREYLETLDKCLPLPEAFHEKLVDALRLYFFVGGMPEAIVTYKDKKDLREVRRVQNDILTGYESDFSKYASPADAQKIAALWESVPIQLARDNKKFKYSDVAKTARARDYENSLK